MSSAPQALQVFRLSERSQKLAIKDSEDWHWKSEKTFKTCDVSMIVDKIQENLTKIKDKIKTKEKCRINAFIAWDLDRNSETFPQVYKEGFGRSFYAVSLISSIDISFIKHGKHYIEYLSKGAVVDVSSYLSSGYTMMFIESSELVGKRRKTVEKEQSYKCLVILFCRRRKGYRNTAI